MTDEIPEGFDYEAKLERHRASIRSRPTGEHWTAFTEEEAEALAKSMTERDLRDFRDQLDRDARKVARRAARELARAQGAADYYRQYPERYRG